MVIPSYNRAQYLVKTLRSIVEQSTKPKEIIIIDDGGTDDSEQAISYIDTNGIALKYLKQKNTGQLHARHNAIMQSSGEWIALCDSDDLWHPDHLSEFVEAMSACHSAALYFANFNIVDENDVLQNDPDKLSQGPENWLKTLKANSTALGPTTLKLPSDFYKYLLRFQPLFPSAMIFKRSLYDNVGGISPKLNFSNSEDAHITRRLAAYGESVCQTKTTVSIRKHSGNFSHDYAQNEIGKAKILQHLCEHNEIPQKYISASLAEVNNTYNKLFSYLVGNNDIAQARKVLKLCEARQLSKHIMTKYYLKLMLSKFSA